MYGHLMETAFVNHEELNAAVQIGVNIHPYH